MDGKYSSESTFPPSNHLPKRPFVSTEAINYSTVSIENASSRSNSFKDVFTPHHTLSPLTATCNSQFAPYATSHLEKLIANDPQQHESPLSSDSHSPPVFISTILSLPDRYAPSRTDFHPQVSKLLRAVRNPFSQANRGWSPKILSRLAYSD
jgi:hypothetical protein